MNLVTAILVAIRVVRAGPQVQPPQAACEGDEMITLENIEITFNKGTPLEMRALRGIELAIPQGQFLTVIGSNRAGKSTLLNILAGESLSPRRGAS